MVARIAGSVRKKRALEAVITALRAHRHTSDTVILMRDLTFSPSHVLRVTRDVAFRTGEFARYALTCYPRADYRAPAQYMDAHAGPHSLVIVDDEPPMTHDLAAEVWLIRAIDPGPYRLNRTSAFGGRIADRRVMSTSHNRTVEVVRIELHGGF